MPFAVGIALAFSAALNAATPATTVAVATPVSPVATQTVQEYVKTYFADEPIMISIARCESRFRQYDKDGSVFRGAINNKDVGIMQINEFYHSAAAAKLGLDLHKLEDNVAYARYLYEKEGTTPWNSSSPCWGKTQVAKDLALAK